ncbi:uncharacterized protein HD556DRAFT_1449781 [Suillus plorans]|uniref:Uncharacterized protein n=1 Tax=Suillus plorans TaxID=116603 RepID=A0A9P7AC57_9AGAM|nr:uncharacterized protein HD556DRAFT_1449781 [Suillus plorans]KAG1786399.1 hypothetical protein HD556DRAFT_1449781 [Suillus plorans]
MESVEAGGLFAMILRYIRPLKSFATSCTTLTLQHRFQLHPIKQRHHHEDHITRRFADWYKQSHFRDKFDIHPCVYLTFLRIVGWFHKDIFSNSNSPTGFNKGINFLQVTLEHDLQTILRNGSDASIGNMSPPRRCILLHPVPFYVIHVLPLMATSFSCLSMLKLLRPEFAQLLTPSDGG